MRGWGAWGVSPSNSNNIAICVWFRPCAPDPLSPRASRLARQGIVRGLILPGEFIERWLIISGSISVFRDIKFLVLVVFNAGTILIAPAVSFPVETARFH